MGNDQRRTARRCASKGERAGGSAHRIGAAPRIPIVTVAILGALAAGGAGSACNPDWDVYDPRLAGTVGASAATGGAGAGGNADAGAGASTATGMGGAGLAGNGAGGNVTSGEGTSADGAGGGGTGGATSCVPGTSISCYTGPAGTEGIGACNAGTQACAEDGLSYGACSGESWPSAELCASVSVADEDCNSKVNDHCSEWSKRFSGGGDQLGLAVAVDASGDIYVAGKFANSIEFGGGSLSSFGGNDIFLAKLSKTGAPIWGKRFGDFTEQQALGIAVDASGNVIITGSFLGSISFGGAGHSNQGAADIFVAKFSSDGTYMWSRSYGDSSEQIGRAVAVSAAGSIYVTGEAGGTVTFNPGAPLTAAGGKDIFLLVLDANGGYSSGKLFGGVGDDAGLAIAAASQNQVLLAGRFDESVTFGAQTFTDGGGIDVFVAKLDQGGNPVFSKSFPALGDESAVGVAEDSGGNVVLLGNFDATLNLGGADLVSAGADDIFVARFTSMGVHLWSQSFGDVADQSASGLALSAAGDALITGSVNGTVKFGDFPRKTVGVSDAFLVKLAGATGDHIWSRTFGDAGNQDGGAVAVDAQGSAILVGDFSGKVDLGSGALTSTGGKDVFLAKLPP